MNDNGLVPIDQKTNNPDVAQQRKAIKDRLWRIDKAIDEGQIVPKPDDGKRPEGTTYIPDNRNSV